MKPLSPGTGPVSRIAPAWGPVATILLLLCGFETRAAADCRVAAVGVNFGIYDPSVTAPDDSVGEIKVTCTHLSGPSIQVLYTVTLSTGSGGSYTPRRLRAGPALLGYNLWSNSSRTSIWGNGGAGTVIVSGALRVGPGAGNRERFAVHPIYGRIPALQDAAEGEYVDSIVATLTY